MIDFNEVTIPTSIKGSIPQKAKWKLRATYNNTVKPPKMPGMLAFEVLLANDSALATEEEICNKRGDLEYTVIKVEY